MGNISFYDCVTPNVPITPTFTPSDLDDLTGLFSEMVPNVTWALAMARRRDSLCKCAERH
jgi:hypothetical protein